MIRKCVRCGTPLTEIGFIRNDDDTVVKEWNCRNKECPKHGHIIIDEEKT